MRIFNRLDEVDEDLRDPVENSHLNLDQAINLCILRELRKMNGTKVEPRKAAPKRKPKEKAKAPEAPKASGDDNLGDLGIGDEGNAES